MVTENIGSSTKPYYVYRISLVDLIKFIIRSEPTILEEIAQFRERHERDAEEGFRTGIRDGENFRRNPLFINDETRDRTLALLFHSDELDTAKNQLGSHSGRSVLVASVAIANAGPTRMTTPSKIHTFLVASKEVLRECKRGDIFKSTVNDILLLRQGL